MINPYSSISQSDSSNIIDLNSCFESFETYTQLTQTTIDLIDNQKKIYERIKDASSINSKLFIQFNRKTIEPRSRLREYISRIEGLGDQRNLHSYYFPFLIFYSFYIKYDNGKSEKYLNMYKMKVSRLYTAAGIKSNKLTRINLEISSVIFKVSLESEKLGTILDISHTYKQYIGVFPDKPVVGSHINELLPPRISKLHQKKIENLGDSDSMTTRKPLVMIDCEKNLLHVTSMVKILPELSKHACAVSIVEFDENLKCINLLLDKNCFIVSGDSVIRRLLSRSNSDIGNSTVKLSAVSKNLEKAYLLFMKIENSNLRVKNRDPKTASFFRQKLMVSLVKVTEMNEKEGIRFSLEKDSVLYQWIDSDVIVQFEFIKILNTQLTSMKISRHISKIDLVIIETRKNMRSGPQSYIDDGSVDTSNKVIVDRQDSMRGKEQRLITGGGLDYFFNHMAYGEVEYSLGELITPILDIISQYILKSISEREVGTDMEHMMDKMPTFINKVFKEEPMDVHQLLKSIADACKLDKNIKYMTNKKVWVYEDKREEAYRINRTPTINNNSNSLNMHAMETGADGYLEQTLIDIKKNISKDDINNGIKKTTHLVPHKITKGYEIDVKMSNPSKDNLEAQTSKLESPRRQSKDEFKNKMDLSVSKLDKNIDVVGNITNLMKHMKVNLFNKGE